MTSPINDIVDQLKRRKAVGLQLYLEDGQLLEMALEGKLYKDIGDHVKTEADFYKELGMSRTDATNKVRVWKKFGKALESQKLGGQHMSIEPSRLVALLPVEMELDGDVVDWCHKAAVLLPTEFRDAVRAERGQVTSTDCQHKEKELHERCKGCGKWLS